MLNVHVWVKAIPDRNVRTYAIPDHLRLLHKRVEVEGTTPEAFNDLEVGNQAPALLAQALFAIPVVEFVKMGKTAFTIKIAGTTSSPTEVDQLVISALLEVIKATTTIAVSYVGLGFSGIDPIS